MPPYAPTSTHERQIALNKNTNEIIRILDMLQANNEPCSIDGIYVCSYCTSKDDFVKDLGELVERGVLARLHDDTYTRTLVSGGPKV